MTQAVTISYQPVHHGDLTVLMDAIGSAILTDPHPVFVGTVGQAQGTDFEDLVTGVAESMDFHDLSPLTFVVSVGTGRVENRPR